MKQIEIVLLVIPFYFFSISCVAQESNRPPNQGPPSTEEIFTQMDSNKDGKLAKSEVKGPLLNDFDKIDADKDGFITKEELEKAPKPQNGQAPPPRNQ